MHLRRDIFSEDEFAPSMVMDRQIVEPGEMYLHLEKAMPVQPEPQVTAKNNEFVCLSSTGVLVNPEKRHLQ